MVESIACNEWIRRNVFDIGGRSTGSEGVGKYLKRRKGEGVETENMQSQKAAITAEQRRLERTRNV